MRPISQNTLYTALDALYGRRRWADDPADTEELEAAIAEIEAALSDEEN